MNISIPSPSAENSTSAPPPPSAKGASIEACWPTHDIPQIKEENIVDPEISNWFWPRCPNHGWWARVEEKENDTAQLGDRFLVRKDEVKMRGYTIMMEYISTRIDDASRWSRQSIAYVEGNPSPYPYHHDCFTGYLV